MKLLKLIFTLILFVFLSACAENLNRVVEQTYEDGSPKQVNFYSANKGEELIKQQSFYENGQLRVEGYFADGKKDGAWKYYYEDGVLWSEGNYKQGAPEGMLKVYNPNTSLYIKGSYKDGARKGIWKFYDENGNLRKEANYDQF